MYHSFWKNPERLNSLTDQKTDDPVSVGLANFYVFHYHPIQHKGISWTSGSSTLEIIMEKVYLNVFL